MNLKSLAISIINLLSSMKKDLSGFQEKKSSLARQYLWIFSLSSLLVYWWVIDVIKSHLFG
jgi:hypothetical protein